LATSQPPTVGNHCSIHLTCSQKQTLTSQKNPLYFYQFLGAHSLLIGLLPFFLPVYLYTQGLGIGGLCILVGVSGISFSAVLGRWQALSSRWPLKRIVTLTFFLEMVLVVTVGLITTVPGSPLFTATDQPANLASTGLLLSATAIGMANGLYNAFFWTTQRTLFLKQLGLNDTGKQFGNFQIFVTVFLKAGILLGGFLLDNGGFLALLAISAGFSFVSAQWLSKADAAAAPLLLKNSHITLPNSVKHTDQYGSRPVFAIDGVFLYLESHLWTLSLFLLVQEDFSRLGLAVVALAIGFAVLFYLIKNSIDRLAVERVYQASVLLYSASWLLRFTLDQDMQESGLLITLLVITFFTSFFRLAFNKRFFDVARSTSSVDYLLLKSYSSQALLGVFYLLLGTIVFLTPYGTGTYLQAIYLFAALLSLVYLRYKDQ